MTLEETIQACFDFYPELYQRREQVLDQLFCTVGNGYEWIDGELIDDDKDKPLNNLDINGKAKQYKVITNSRIEQYKFIIKNPEDSFLYPKKDNNKPKYISNESFYPLCRKYSKLFNYPSDIKEDWLAGIKETYEYIINNISSDCNNNIDIFREISKDEVIEIYNKKFKQQEEDIMKNLTVDNPQITEIYNYLNNNYDNEIVLKHKTITEFRSGNKEFMFPISLQYDYCTEKPFYLSLWTEDGYKDAWDLHDRFYKDFRENVCDVDGGCGGGVGYQYEFNNDEFITFLKSLDLTEWDISFK